MTTPDYTYDEALRQRAADLSDVLATVDVHLDELRGELRHHLDFCEVGRVAGIRRRLSLAVALHDEATDHLEEVQGLIDARVRDRSD